MMQKAFWLAVLLATAAMVCAREMSRLGRPALRVAYLVVKFLLT